jgi:hypothetical protein
MNNITEIFGSYEKSLSESKTLIGHNDTTYMVGGNARYNLKSNMEEWELASNSNLNGQINSINLIKIINQILNISPQITDHDELYIFLQELNKLKNDEFVKFMEKSLNLYEPIQIQLRNLFYVILNKFTDGGKNDKYHVGFCKFEPLTRINNLLNALDPSDLSVYVTDGQFDKIIEQYTKIKFLIESKLGDSNFANGGAPIDSNDNLKSLMDRIIESHKPLFPILNKIEKKNIEIAECLAAMSEVLKSINIVKK